MKTIFNWIILLLLFSCQEKSNKIGINEKSVYSDTIAFVPTPENSQKIKANIYRAFGLDSLKASKDLLEVRVFRYYSDIDPIRLFVIKQIEGKWSGYITSLTIESNKTFDSVRYISEERIAQQPKSGWDSLGKKILELGILEIGKKFPLHDNSSSDAFYVVVEYVAKDGYRKYESQDPEDFKMPGSIRLTQILQIIESELDFKNFASLTEK